MSTKRTRHPILRTRGIAHGRYRLRRSGVACVWIAERVRAGEPIKDVAKDYDITLGEARAAIRFLRRFARRKR